MRTALFETDLKFWWNLLQFSSSSLEVLPHQLCHSDSYTANFAFETLVLLLEEINFGLGLLIDLKIDACQLFTHFASDPGSTFSQNGTKGLVI